MAIPKLSDEDQSTIPPNLPLVSPGVALPPPQESPTPGAVKPIATPYTPGTKSPAASLITADDLDQALSAKKELTLAGSIGDNLANRQSFGNFFLHQLNPKQDVMGQARQQMGLIDQGLKDKQVLQDQAMKAPELQYMQQAMDKQSDISQFATKTNQAQLDRVKQALYSNNPQGAATVDSMKQKLAGLSAYEQTQLLDKTGMNKLFGQEAMSADKLYAMMGRLQNQNITKAQTTVNTDKTLSTYIPRLDGAAKILNLMDVASKNQDVKSNQALLGQLNAEIARLETGSQSPGLGAAEKTEMHDTSARLHDILDTLSGGVTGVDLSAKFKQARGMVNDLAGSYMNQVDDRMNFLKSGAMPDQQPIFDAKHNQLKYSYGKRFGQWGMPGSEQPQGGGAPQGGGEQGGSLISSANAGGPQTKMIGDQPYIKVPGGWKRSP